LVLELELSGRSSPKSKYSLILRLDADAGYGSHVLLLSLSTCPSYGFVADDELEKYRCWCVVVVVVVVLEVDAMYGNIIC
jgi:hypothetical protein